MIKKGRASLADVETELSALRSRLPLSAPVAQHPVMSVWQGKAGTQEGNTSKSTAATSVSTCGPPAPKTKYFDGVVWGSDVVLDKTAVTKKTTGHEDDDIMRYLRRAKREFAQSCEESIGQFEYDEALEERKVQDGQMQVGILPDGSRVVQSTVVVKLDINSEVLTTAPTVGLLLPEVDVTAHQSAKSGKPAQDVSSARLPAAPVPPKVAKPSQPPKGLYDLPGDVCSQTKVLVPEKGGQAPGHARRSKSYGDGESSPGARAPNSESFLVVESTTAALIPPSSQISTRVPSDSRMHHSPAPSANHAAARRKESLSTAGTVVAHSSVDLTALVSQKQQVPPTRSVAQTQPSPPRPRAQPTTLVVSHVNSGRVRFCPQCAHVVLGDGGGFCPHCRAAIAVAYNGDDVEWAEDGKSSDKPDDDASRHAALDEVSRIEAEERAAFQAAIAEWRSAPKDPQDTKSKRDEVPRNALRPASASISVGTGNQVSVPSSGQYMPLITHNTYFSFLWRQCIGNDPASTGHPALVQRSKPSS